MPTLIRLVVILLVLVGLGYGAMFGIVAMVDPGEKDVTVRIPARNLVAAPERAPVVRREIDTSRPAPVPAPEPVEALPAAETATDGSVVTVAPPGTE